MIYNKMLIIGANGMLGTTMQKYIDINKCLLVDKERDHYGIVKCNINDFKHIRNIVEEYNPDIIINLAAEVDLEFCHKNPLICYNTNTISAINLFEIAKEMIDIINKNLE